MQFLPMVFAEVTLTKALIVLAIVALVIYIGKQIF